MRHGKCSSTVSDRKASNIIVEGLGVAVDGLGVGVGITAGTAGLGLAMPINDFML